MTTLPSFLPVMKYDLDAGPLSAPSQEGQAEAVGSGSSSLGSSPPSPPQTPSLSLHSPAPSSSAAATQKGLTQPPPAAAGPAPPSAPAGAGSVPQGSGAVASRKAPPRQPPKRRVPVELRAKAVFRALEKLMEGSMEEEQLWAVARILSADEFEQVSEERALAGHCGNPLCPKPASAPPSAPARKYKIDLAKHMVFAMEAPPPFCSADCEDAVARFAARLGSHHAAQHRFELLMRTAQQAERGGEQGQGDAQPSAAHPAAAVAATSLANGRAAADSRPAPSQQTPAALLAGTPKRAQPAGQVVLTAESPSSPTDNSRIRWDHGIVPSQWNAMVSHSSSTTTTSTTSGRGNSIVNSSIPGSSYRGADARSNGCCHAAPAASRTLAAAARAADQAGSGPKGVLKTKAGSQYVAGTAKTPIMLAEVKERNPSMVAADSARSLPPDVAAGMRAAVASRVGPIAVEGYVPRAGKSQFKQLQASGAQQVRGRPQEAGQGEELAAPGGGPSPQRRRVRFSDEEGGSLEMPSAAELAASAASTAVPAVPACAHAGPPGNDGGEKGAAAPTVERDGPAKQQTVQGASVAPSMPAAPTGTVGMGSGATAVAGNGKAPGTLAVGGGISWGPDEPTSPMLVFDIEDPQGPLEVAGAADGEAGGLSAQFGQLRVVDSSEAVPATDGSPALQQPQPRSPQHPLASSAVLSPTQVVAQQRAQEAEQAQALGGSNVEEALQKQMQASLRRLFPRLSGTLPPEMDAGLEAQLASEDEESEVESAGWSSSEEDETVERMAPGAEGSDEDGEDRSAHRPSAYRISLSFFGTLFTHVESWITDATLELLASGPGAGAPASAAALPPPSPHSQQIEAALASFLGAVLPLVAAQLRIAAPRGDTERALNELLRTMRFAGPLPPFKSSQWQLVAIIFLKALSLERYPALREAFETREGVQRLGKALAGLAFTIEELYAMLELLCPAD